MSDVAPLIKPSGHYLARLGRQQRDGASTEPLNTQVDILTRLRKKQSQEVGYQGTNLEWSCVHT